MPSRYLHHYNYNSESYTTTMAEHPSKYCSAQPPTWTELNDLSSSSIGGEVIFSTDDWFAAAENLLSTSDPQWKEGFTEQGKWMDGWETRRKRIPGHDWCIIKLGLPGKIYGVELDTSFFTGNFAPRASIQATWLDEEPVLEPRYGEAGQAATKAQLAAVDKLRSDKWETIVEMSSLGAGYKDTCQTFLVVRDQGPFTHIRLNIFPDGGVARLRTYGIAVPSLPDSEYSLLDLVSANMGGVCIGYSDAHYGHPRNMIKTGRGKDMGDGWETARRLDRPPILVSDQHGILQVPGSEWAAFKLGLPGAVRAVEIDTNHFKGNYPDSVIIEAANVTEDLDDETTKKMLLNHSSMGKWKVLLPASKLSAHKQHYFPMENLTYTERVTHIRVRMFPDGGISRIGILGRFERI